MSDSELNKVCPKELTLAMATAFSEQINNMLRNNTNLKEAGLIPMDMADPLKSFETLRDGRILCHLINYIQPDTIPQKNIKMAVNTANLKKVGCNDIFEIAHNCNSVVNGARKIGCKMVNIGGEDISGGNIDLILGMLWQLIRAYFMRDINLAGHPELIRLLEPGETLDKMMALSGENMIIRWFNYHLEKGEYDGKIKNFGKDMADCTKWVVLFQQVAPQFALEAGIDDVLKTDDRMERATRLLKVAEELDCREFATAKDIVAGNQRLGLGFTCTIFNEHIGINLPTEDELDQIYCELDQLGKDDWELSAQKKELEDRLSFLENGKGLLASHVDQLERDLESVEIAVVETDESLSNDTWSVSNEMAQLNNTADEIEKAIEKQAALLQQLKEEDIESENKHAPIIEEQLAHIQSLEENEAKLLEEKTILQEQLESQHNDIKGTTDYLLEKTAANSDKQRALEEHIRQSNDTLQQHFLRLKSPDMALEMIYTDVNAAMSVNLASKEALVEKYNAEYEKVASDFEQHKEESNRRMEEINASVSYFLDGEQKQTGDAINDMQRLLELMMDKCNRQSVQVKTLELTIQKKDQLN
eukprot:Ihof_evm1s692 gene=Ihof_evmTU1s692